MSYLIIVLLITWVICSALLSIPVATWLSEQKICHRRVISCCPLYMQGLNISPQQQQWVVDHMGHTLDIHHIHYRSTMDIIERIDITKLLLMMDSGQIGRFKNKKLEDIQLEGNCLGFFCTQSHLLWLNSVYWVIWPNHDMKVLMFQQQCVNPEEVYENIKLLLPPSVFKTTISWVNSIAETMVTHYSQRYWP